MSLEADLNAPELEWWNPRLESKPRPEREYGFKTECSECGQTTTLPFAPKPGRKNYCDKCWRARRQ